MKLNFRPFSNIVQSGNSGIDKNIVQFFFIYFTFWLADACLSPYLGVVYLSKGLSGTQISLLEIIIYVVTPLSAIAMGIISDRLRSSRSVLIFLVFGVIAATAVLFFSQGYLPIILCVLAYGFCYAPFSDLVDKMLIDRLGSDSPRFGRIRMGGTIGHAIGAGISGGLMLLFGVPVLYVAYWAVMLCCAVICKFLPKIRTEYAKPRAKDFLKIIKSKSFVPIYVTLMVFGFTDAGNSHFEALHILRCGYESYYVSLFIGVQMIGECAAFWLAPKAIKHLNINLILCIVFFLQIIKSSSLQVLGYLPVTFTIVGQSISGGAFALIYSTMAHNISKNFQGNVSNVAQTMKSMATQGIGMAIGVLVFGGIYDYGSTTTVYAIITVLSILCTLYFLVKFIVLKRRAV